MKVKITGMKYFTGTVDGKAINSGRLYCELKLDDSRNDSDKQWAVGTCTEEFTCSPDLVKKLVHLPRPFLAELEIERVGTGRETRERITDVKPLERAQGPSKLPAAA